MTESILVPIAPGGQFFHLTRAVWLARCNGAEIILLCVKPHGEPLDRGELECAQLAARLEALEISIKSLVSEGFPARAILNVAREEMLDLSSWTLSNSGM